MYDVILCAWLPLFVIDVQFMFLFRSCRTWVTVVMVVGACFRCGPPSGVNIWGDRSVRAWLISLLTMGSA